MAGRLGKGRQIGTHYTTAVKLGSTCDGWDHGDERVAPMSQPRFPKGVIHAWRGECACEGEQPLTCADVCDQKMV